MSIDLQKVRETSDHLFRVEKAFSTREVFLFKEIHLKMTITFLNTFKNAHYIITFDNLRDTLGLRTSAQQAFAGHVPYAWKIFQDATLQPYGYLVMDLHRRTPIT